ncbi:MAG: cation:dicarboxylase symporter family transporter, partial [Gammaproteobacteria bacterium]
MYIQPTLAALGRLSLSVRIIAGLGLGVFVGLFVGEPAATLQPVADIYIRLMQMTVLPYLVM